MEKLFFSQDNIVQLLKNANKELKFKMPKNNVDKGAISSILTTNMKKIIGGVDNSRVNSSNFKNVLNQMNKAALDTTIKQFTNTDAVYPNKLARDTDIYNRKVSFNLDMDRPMVIDSRTKKVNQNDFDSRLMERDNLDSQLGIKPSEPPRKMIKEDEKPTEEVDQFGNLEDPNQGFSDISAFETSITENLNIDDSNLESFADRLKRIQREREVELAPDKKENAMNNEYKQPDFQTQEFKTSQFREPEMQIQQRQIREPEMQIQQRQIREPEMQIQQRQIQYKEPEIQSLAQIQYKEPETLKYQQVTENRIIEPIEYAPPKVSQNKIIEYSKDFINLEEKKAELLELNNQILRRQNALEENILILKKREQQLLELEDKYKNNINLFQNLNNQDFIHLLIDTKIVGSGGMNNYVYNLNPILNNVNKINIINISVPSNYNNILKDTELIFKIDDLEYKILINCGYYTVESLVKIINNNNNHFEMKLNETKGTLLIESEKKISIVSNELMKRLGFTEEELLIASDKPDLRTDKYLDLFILNLNEKEPLCIVNTEYFTPTLINLKNPITLDKLAICFKNRDGTIADFEKGHHLIEFRIHYMN